jgi:hypothetical protein
MWFFRTPRYPVVTPYRDSAVSFWKTVWPTKVSQEVVFYTFVRSAGHENAYAGIEIPGQTIKGNYSLGDLLWLLVSFVLYLLLGASLRH